MHQPSQQPAPDAKPLIPQSARTRWSARTVLFALVAISFIAAATVLVPAPRSIADDAATTDAADAALAAAEDADDGGPFMEVVDVNLINVEVYVTDKKGNRITGLKKDDFVLTVDKKPVAITNFYAVEGGVPVSEQLDTIDRPDLPEPSPARLAMAQDRPEDQKLHLIVYIDNFNLQPFSRNRVIRAARTWLRENLRPGDEVMLVSYDRSLKVRHPFTRDAELVASAMYELEDISAHRTHYASERSDMLGLIYDDAEELYDVYGRARQYAESINNDMSFTLKALREQVETLAGLPGRKAILYVSEGLPWSPAEDIFHALNDRFKESTVLLDVHRFDLNRRYQSLISQANANRVTFYTVDAAGLRTYTYMDASNATFGGGANIDQIHFSNMQNTLRFIAEETGGMAILNTNNFTPLLDKVSDDFQTYYSLGFPAVGQSGRYHNIKIELKDDPKGIQLRYREGYRDKPVSTRMSEATLAALNYGYQKSDLGVQLEAGREERQQDGQYVVPMVIKIPIGELTFLPQEEVHRGRVRLYIAARDQEGGTAEVQEVPVPIDIPADQMDVAKEKYYNFTVSLLMRRGRQVVSVAARDEIGATIGVVSKGVSIGV